MADKHGKDDKKPADAASHFYVLAGIPCMIIFFVVLFTLVGACDVVNVMIPA